MLGRDVRFSVVRNLFAIDQIASRMLAGALCHEGRRVDHFLLATAQQAADHVEKAYVISCKAQPQRAQLE